MKVHRANKSAGNFTQVANSVILDKQLSLKARGLMAYLLSLPPAWNLNVKGLVTTVGHDGRDSVRSAFRELEQLGYVVRANPRDSQGRIRPTAFEVFEAPNTKASPKTAQNPNVPPQTGFPALDNPAPVNPTLCNTIASNTVSERKTRIDNPSISSLSNKEKPSVPVSSATGNDVVAGYPLSEYTAGVDRSMEQNLDLARTRYWLTVDANVRGTRSFSDVFGQKPRVAWATTEFGYLKEIVEFCAQQWPDKDPLAATGAIVREAFRRHGKARQFLTYWVQHGRSRVSLRPFLTLGGGTQDLDKRLDILRELAVTVDVGTVSASDAPASVEPASVELASVEPASDAPVSIELGVRS